MTEDARLPGAASGSQFAEAGDAGGLGGARRAAAGLEFEPLTAVAAAVREGRLSPVELVSAQLERARTVGAALGCFVTVAEDEALAAAERLEAALESGEAVGPLHGVPVTVKDNIAVAGLRMTAASGVFADQVPAEDAAAVVRLKRAGAVVLGKTNLSELAFGSSHPAFGEPLNPWDPERSTGGSSSGSASALAAGIGYGSVGTDTGGSIRIPASMCGLVGLKPTFGLVELAGVVTISRELDHVGPMGRTVRDVAVLLDVMARDGWERRRLADLDGVGAGLRLGVLADEELSGVHPAAVRAVETARDALEAAGCETRVVSLPDRDLARSTMWTIAAVDLLVDLEAHLRSPGMGEGLRSALERAAGTSAATYVKARRARDELTAELDAVFASIDVLLTPGVPIPAHTTAERAALRDVRQAYTPLFDLTGHPALVVPASLSREGLPLGVQLVGRRFADDVVLGAGLVVEEAVGSPWAREDVRGRVTATVERLAAQRPVA
ncbi:MAG TPA: amidase [Trueperaceae bacterium]